MNVYHPTSYYSYHACYDAHSAFYLQVKVTVPVQGISVWRWRRVCVRQRVTAARQDTQQLVSIAPGVSR